MSVSQTGHVDARFYLQALLRACEDVEDSVDVNLSRLVVSTTLGFRYIQSHEIKGI